MSTYSEREILCEMEFETCRPFWHLYTDGTRMENIFKDEEEMRLALISLAVSSCLFGKVEIITFELMSNHIHLILRGERDDCLKLFTAFKDRLRRLYHKLGLLVDWSRFSADILPVETLRALRNEIVYVHRNAFVADPRYTPCTYPWGGGLMYFSGFAKAIPTLSISEIGFNKARQLTHCREVGQISKLRFIGDKVFIPSFCRVDIGERMFQDARSYFNMLTRKAEAFSEVASRLKDMVFLTDDEMYAVAVQNAEQSFGNKRLQTLSPGQRIELARLLFLKFNASKSQLRRILRLENRLLDELFPTP